MRTLLLSFALVLATGLQAQALLLEQERWPDGTLRSTRYSEGGNTHFITYHENGRVKEIGGFRSGKRDGTWKQYSDAGVLVARATFRNGQGQRIWVFSSTGAPLGRVAYDEGCLAHAEQLNADGVAIARRDYR